MKKKFLLVPVIAILGITCAGCQTKQDDKFSFEASREYRCEEKEVVSVDTISVKEISATYAYTEENKVYISIYEPHFLIKGIPYLEENDFVLTRYMSNDSEAEYPKGIAKRIDSEAGVRIVFETDAQEM